MTTDEDYAVIREQEKRSQMLPVEHVLQLARGIQVAARKAMPEEALVQAWAAGLVAIVESAHDLCKARLGGAA